MYIKIKHTLPLLSVTLLCVIVLTVWNLYYMSARQSTFNNQHFMLMSVISFFITALGYFSFNTLMKTSVSKQTRLFLFIGLQVCFLSHISLLMLIVSCLMRSDLLIDNLFFGISSFLSIGWMIMMFVSDLWE
jgi:hypothetical protein